MDLKEQVVKMMQDTNQKYWDKYPNEKATETTQEQKDFIDKLDKQLATDLIDHITREVLKNWEQHGII